MLKKLGNKFVRIYDNLTNADSGWDRKYDFCLIFGQTEETKSPWKSNIWKSDFEPYFDLLIKQTENLKENGIKVLKYNVENRISKKNNKEFKYHSEIKLGKLKWDEKSHDKWTIADRIDNQFLNFEFWKPIWTICDKKQMPPDIFITISNERDINNKRNIKFGYFIVIAIAKNLNIDFKPILSDLSEKINSKATIVKTRRWSKPEKAGDWTFGNSIQDTFSNGIYKSQDVHNFEFDQLNFEPEFEIIYKHK